MKTTVIAHNIRSTHNVGSIFRTCEGFGVDQLVLSGYTPYPLTKADGRLPHIAERLTAQIDKTALGATTMVAFRHVDDIAHEIQKLKTDGWQIVALEQTPHAIQLPDYVRPEKCCLILGEEVHGVPAELLELCDETIEIPMRGQKESFNVSVAAGIALYGLSL